MIKRWLTRRAARQASPTEVMYPSPVSLRNFAARRPTVTAYSAELNVGFSARIAGFRVPVGHAAV